MPDLISDRKLKWHYETEGQGECFLFIHGWAADNRVWNQQLEYFKDFYRVVSVDLPGHGRSDWQDGSLEQIARDLDLLFNTLKVELVNLAASSFGGLAALKYIEIFPNRVKRLILVGAGPRFARSEEFPFGLAVPRIKKLREQVKTDFPEILNVFFRSLFTVQERESLRFIDLSTTKDRTGEVNTAFSREKKGRYTGFLNIVGKEKASKWLQMFERGRDLPNQEALIKFLRIIEKEDLTEAFENITCPVYLLSGREDYICPPEALKYFQSRLPQARVEFFEDCGHFPFLSQPQQFNALVKDFLTNRTPGVRLVKRG